MIPTVIVGLAELVPQMADCLAEANAGSGIDLEVSHHAHILML